MYITVEQTVADQKLLAEYFEKIDDALKSEAEDMIVSCYATALTSFKTGIVKFQTDLKDCLLKP